jgi:hypothetical protein
MPQLTNRDPVKSTQTVDDLARRAGELRQVLERLLRDVKELIANTEKMTRELPDTTPSSRQPK